MSTLSGATSAWVRRFHPDDQAATRLVCFPHAGGSATYYFPVSRALSGRAGVLAIQYPGRQDRRAERCVDDVRELADLVVGELRPFADRPMALFGHSLGATLAFEVALRLEAEGIVPLVLFASGRRAPSKHRDERVHLGTDEQLLRTLERMSGTDAQVLRDEEMVRSLLPAIRGDYRAAETYRYVPGPPLACPIVVLTGDRDPEVTRDEATAWEGHTTGPFALHEYPGGHFFLNDHAPTVIELIGDHLEQVRLG
ncbi:thioesterase II family protein [Rhizomonospora bruguierae]|uniref:thioesterase II family protein n=1 Tax=Rhizomonospora bruguierae TaxID=1581705 RepID=UPI001BCBABCC|nr:alpha/beta fold hydrolase [Micromonospora sp. NBRC 107566]